MIAWHVYPLGFVGAPIMGGAPQEVVHRLGRLTDWVGYAAELGVDALSLGPVFASQTHGYDTVDYFRVDPRLGDDGDLDRLIATAHDAGLRILLDGVFNHVGDQHPLYQAALKLDPQASRYFSWPGGKARVFEGHSGLVQLNHDEECVVGLVQDVMRHWMRHGVDGWRLDAAYATGPDFWGRVLPDIRAEFPGSYIFGELIHGDQTDFVIRSGVDSVTQYELWKAIWSSLRDPNFFELSWALGRHNEMLRAFAPVTFVGNHDVTRIVSQVGAEKSVLALVVLMTVGGAPHIYYGDEQGFVAVKEERIGGDDAIRPEFPANPGELSPSGWWLYDLHRRLIALRHEHGWLERAETANVELTGQRYVYRVANPADQAQWLTVAVDVTDASHPWATVSDAHGEIFAYHA